MEDIPVQSFELVGSKKRRKNKKQRAAAVKVATIPVGVITPRGLYREEEEVEERKIEEPGLDDESEENEELDEERATRLNEQIELE